MKTSLKIAVICIGTTIIHTTAFSQRDYKPVAAVIAIDSHGVSSDSQTASYMVRLELEKTNMYYVMDKYEVEDAMRKNGIDASGCFGKSCVVAAGKVLEVDKMVTGSVDRLGEKIVVSLKVIDVKTESIEKQEVTEYLNLQSELQKMIGISVQKMLGLTPDPNMVGLLINYDVPIESPRTQINLSGPRMGGMAITGNAGRIMVAPQEDGGYDMFPVMFNFGWQHEWQYLSAGDFQALIEFIPMISGIESGKFIPSVTFLNGFRVGKGGWEFGFGPSFRIVKKLDGFWGTGEYGTENGQWYRKGEWNQIASTLTEVPDGNPFPIVKGLDSRGSEYLSTGLMMGVGRTFHSGYLNIPVNVFVSPRKEGTTVGFSFGFNIQKAKKLDDISAAQ